MLKINRFISSVCKKTKNLFLINKKFYTVFDTHNGSFSKALNLVVFSACIISLLTINSCDKNAFTTNPSDKLIFSTDTVQFDTIFTNIGSATNYFIVKNSNSSKSIKIDRIFVAKGSNSKYRLNIDGIPANNIKDIELYPGDSIFIFVEVTIDPNRDEMIEEDSVMFESNGNTQNVKLVSFGQDVTLLNGNYISNDTTWNADKPVLIYNSALVDTLVRLTVNAGSKVYFHRGASLFVKGSLIVNGQLDNMVTFTGDRLEEHYSETAGQWGAFLQDNYGNTTGIFGGIHLLAGSMFNEINYAEIKNSIIGLQVDSCVTPGIPTVTLKNTNIENSKIVGLYALGAHIEAENCVFANSGQYNLACLIGGEYSFIHCTLANYWIGNRQTPQLILNNYYTYNVGAGTQVSYRDLTNAYFGNCIIYGSRDNEIALDLAEDAEANFRFDNCLIKSKEYEDIQGSDFFIDNIWNLNPEFVETTKPYDYHLDTLSPAKDTGKQEIGQLVPVDQDGNSRLSDSAPDIGAYERQE
ncbi:MAG: choice-of-anchor Q domain-containing protein [Bacteroidales bacterium]|nr:choice-of-anchor Q domain-containing protein [Bacteroidales bacterium]